MPGSAPRHRVLCVDDESLVLSALARTLRADYEVVTAGSGPVALELLRRDGPFSVVIADHRMPGMTGVELLTAARAECAEVTRVVLSGYIDEECSRIAHQDADVFQMLQKPWDTAELRQIVRDAVARHDEQVAAIGEVAGQRKAR